MGGATGLDFKDAGAEMSVRNTSEIIGPAVGQMSLEIRGNVWAGEIDLGGDTYK